jgi:hypothetical protein
MDDFHCPECGETEDNGTKCNHCERLLCIDCVEWCSEDHDELSGDYFCEKCIDELAEQT